MYFVFTIIKYTTIFEDLRTYKTYIQRISVKYLYYNTHNSLFILI